MEFRHWLKDWRMTEMPGFAAATTAFRSLFPNVAGPGAMEATTEDEH